MNVIHTLTTSALLLTLSACSSSMPLEISGDIPNAPSFSQIHKQPDSYLNQPLRWGGKILKTENKENSSWVTIVAFPLSDSGRPLESDSSPGRFIAVIDEFMEPLVYSKDREITVRGKLIGTQTIKVGNFPYQYPLIKVDNYHLWAPKPDINEINPPYFWPYYGPVPYYNRHLYY
jgi:outer membrane lipoprotein